jgi:hypothetical protein
MQLNSGLYLEEEEEEGGGGIVLGVQKMKWGMKKGDVDPTVLSSLAWSQSCKSMWPYLVMPKF